LHKRIRIFKPKCVPYYLGELQPLEEVYNAPRISSTYSPQEDFDEGDYRHHASYYFGEPSAQNFDYPSSPYTLEPLYPSQSKLAKRMLMKVVASRLNNNQERDDDKNTSEESSTSPLLLPKPEFFKVNYEHDFHTDEHFN
jgi:hypothetical protein